MYIGGMRSDMCSLYSNRVAERIRDQFPMGSYWHATQSVRERKKGKKTAASSKRMTQKRERVSYRKI